MSTYADLQAQVALDLRRSNLTAEIAQAILDAIDCHSIERFYFNQTATYSFSTVAATDQYLIENQAPIQEFVMIDAVRTLIGNTWYRLMMLTPEEMDDTTAVPSSAQPMFYSMRGNTMTVYPTPNDVFSMRVTGHYRTTPLVDGTDSNDWTNAAKKLIRYSAVKRLFAYPIRDANEAQVAEQAEIRELVYLRRETDRRQRRGQMAAYY